MKFSKKIRCPFCDGKIKYEHNRDCLDRFCGDRLLKIPNITKPFCTSCGKEFEITIKTEGELEITLEDFN